MVHFYRQKSCFVSFCSSGAAVSALQSWYFRHFGRDAVFGAAVPEAPTEPLFSAASALQFRQCCIPGAVVSGSSGRAVVSAAGEIRQRLGVICRLQSPSAPCPAHCPGAGAGDIFYQREKWPLCGIIVPPLRNAPGGAPDGLLFPVVLFSSAALNWDFLTCWKAYSYFSAQLW